MSFRRLHGVKLPEEVQGLIRYTCLCYSRQPKKIRDKIDSLCEVCGGDYSAALFDVMCTRRSMTEISLKHNISEPVLYRKRRDFYEQWNTYKMTEK